MILYNNQDLINYFVNQLGKFKSIDSKLIIVDRYFGGNSTNLSNIDTFVQFISKLLPKANIIWFYDGSKISNNFLAP